MHEVLLVAGAIILGLVYLAGLVSVLIVSRNEEYQKMITRKERNRFQSKLLVVLHVFLAITWFVSVPITIFVVRHIYSPQDGGHRYTGKGRRKL